jgi:hypothetical protein
MCNRDNPRKRVRILAQNTPYSPIVIDPGDSLGIDITITRRGSSVESHVWAQKWSDRGFVPRSYHQTYIGTGASYDRFA